VTSRSAEITSATSPIIVEAKPHRWATSAWARAFRRVGRPWFVTKHARSLCQPFDVEGKEHLESIGGPALIVANHTSHFDPIIVLSTLPQRLFDRTAIVAAADRHYSRKPWKAAWHSLRYNTFPITRGGGRAALEYSQEMLRKGNALLIFPEGRRSRTAEQLPFHPGPAILALSERVPVVPMHIEGAINILPAGERVARAAAVRVRIGAPIWFDEGTSISDATARMEEAVRNLAGEESRVTEERVLVA
jgi:1-acyl-sn-glycerol-3-phosphate acyltransferase